MVLNDNMIIKKVSKLSLNIGNKKNNGSIY